jgi:hypothetical protein
VCPENSVGRPAEIRNYRDWITIDVDPWRHYRFGMVNRVKPQPHWWDEQWTISVQHTEADTDKHSALFRRHCASAVVLDVRQARQVSSADSETFAA